MRVLFFSALAMLLLGACSTPELQPKEALEMINKELKYPRPITHTINKVDGVQADIARSSTLISDGLLSVIAVGEVIPKGRDMIELTEKGKTYAVPAADLPEHQVKVRVAQAAIPGPESVHLRTGSNGKVALATYAVSYTDLTPFKAMVPQRDFSKKDDSGKAFFALDDQGKWQLVSQPGPEFMEFGY